METSKKFIIQVNVDGTAVINEDDCEAMPVQNFGNAFEMAKVSAQKFISDEKALRGMKAKKEVDNAQRDSKLAEGDKDKET